MCQKLFVFEGELVETQGYLVELHDDLFNLLPCIMVPDVGHARGLLAKPMSYKEVDE
jgi:hypothetical protein